MRPRVAGMSGVAGGGCGGVGGGNFAEGRSC